MATEDCIEECSGFLERMGFCKKEDFNGNSELYEDLNFADLLLKATTFKEKGNALFKSGDWEGAKKEYTSGLDVCKVATAQLPQDTSSLGLSTRECNLNQVKAALIGNRGFMYLKLKKYFDAIRDLGACVLICQIPNLGSKLPSYKTRRVSGFISMEVKALYRRSLAFQDLGNNNQALMDITSILGVMGEPLTEDEVPDAIKEATKADLIKLSNIASSVSVTKTTYKHDKLLVDTTSKWRKIPAVNRVQGRQGHSAVYWGDCIYILGGQDNKMAIVADFHMFELYTQKWVRLAAPQEVRGRFNHTAVTYKNMMVVYGGFMPGRQDIGKCWRYDFVKQTWNCTGVQWKTDTRGKSALRSNYPYLEEHTSVVIGSNMYVFGGRGRIGKKEISHSCNLYSFDLEHSFGMCSKLSGYDDKNPYELGINHPEPRYNHASWGDQDNNRLYILGGAMSRDTIPDGANGEISIMAQFGFEHNNHTLQDLWYYDIMCEQWTKQELYGNFPAPRCEFGAVSTSKGAVIFGGFTGALKTSLNYNTNGEPKHIFCSRYLGDAFHFISSTQSFTSIPHADIGFRARPCLVTDGDDRIYAVHGYCANQSVSMSALAAMYNDIHIMDIGHSRAQKLARKTVKTCVNCETSSNAEKLRKCAGPCGGTVSYCSKLCQKQHWKVHKEHCKGKTEP